MTYVTSVGFALRLEGQLDAACTELVQKWLALADDTPPSNAEIIDQLASIVSRTVDLIQLATTGPYNSRSPKKIAKRLWDMNKHIEAEEFETLAVRAKELRLASSASS